MPDTTVEVWSFNPSYVWPNKTSFQTDKTQYKNKVKKRIAQLINNLLNVSLSKTKTIKLNAAYTTYSQTKFKKYYLIQQTTNKSWG